MSNHSNTPDPTRQTAKTPKKSPQTVTPSGQRVAALIDGVLIRQAVTHQDDRGSLCEIYSQAMQFDDLPLVHAYLITVRPGKVKGWAIHDDQVDRYFFVQGSLKLVLCDNRPSSKTYQMINELYFSELNRSLVSVPPHIYHAVENVGSTDALMFSIPSDPYNYENPDKWTLPIDTDLIPYKFSSVRGY